MIIAPFLRRIAQFSPTSWRTHVNGWSASELQDRFQQLRELGFDSVLCSGAADGNSFGVNAEGSDANWNLERLAISCKQSGLLLLIDLEPPQHFSEADANAWVERLNYFADSGVSGARCLGLAQLHSEQWDQLLELGRTTAPDFSFTAWTPGVPRDVLSELNGVGFDACFSSLAWWDQRSPWLIQEIEVLRQLAPVIGPSCLTRNADEPLDPRTLINERNLEKRLWTAVYLGQGLMIDAHRAVRLGGTMKEVNAGFDHHQGGQGTPIQLSGPLSPNTIMYWTGGAATALVVHNAGPQEHDRALRILQARLPDGFFISNHDVGLARADPGMAVTLVPVQRCIPVQPRHIAPGTEGDAETEPASISEPKLDLPRRRAPDALKQAMDTTRIVIDQVSPNVDDGRFPVKLILGRALSVQATVFMDGHTPLCASLLWRPADKAQWQSCAMRPLGNDRWEGQFEPERLGRYYYAVKARTIADIEANAADQSMIFPLQVERREAEYSSWYELFPRSMGVSGQHGRLLDVIGQLPRVRAMGFDVLYFPPIHPIGVTNRKGRNNALTAQPSDPGSPYAIGSEFGGHDVIHPDLGDLADFQTLLAAARHYELEVALDFAIQCSPDHPWLRQHPEWFRWREDGTVQYAENPPKRYEDIVNPDFYSAAATTRQRMALWRALRDVVLFWAGQGVRMFRVDNPHTKPLPFWEWLIGDVQRRYPDIVFLSEAFTRPAMMFRLAKLGFSQSYTYFTWRNTKTELTDFLTELVGSPQRHYFRPHFFVNTPDINPYFLQTSGRGGFLIRAALAATTSGLWGAYSGFELCESLALADKEEYQNSEKYELRARDWNQPGNIVAEITHLNAIRRANPALQTHEGIHFHFVADTRVLFFSKTAPEGDSIVFVAISLSPHELITVTLLLPSWAGAYHESGIRLRSLWDERDTFIMNGELEVTLTPDQPFALWSLRP